MDIRQALAMPNRGSIEQWARTGAQMQYLGTMRVTGSDVPIVLCRVLHKFMMVVSSLDLSVSPHLMFNGMWEPWITMAIARHVKEGMVCVDVGAQQGYYTLLMADLVGADGHVVAFEPQQWACMCMERSLDLNGLRKRVTHWDMALSDKPGAGKKLYMHPYLQGNASLKKLPSLGEADEVDVTTLDAVLADPRLWGTVLGDPDFVKIDAEQLENEVLDGMKVLLERKREITICVEVTGPAAPMAEKYAAQGFDVGTVGVDGQVRKFDPNRDEREDWQMIWLERK